MSRQRSPIPSRKRIVQRAAEGAGTVFGRAVQRCREQGDTGGPAGLSRAASAKPTLLDRTTTVEPPAHSLAVSQDGHRCAAKPVSEMKRAICVTGLLESGRIDWRSPSDAPGVLLGFNSLASTVERTVWPTNFQRCDVSQFFACIL